MHYRLAKKPAFHRELLRAVRRWGGDDPTVSDDRERARRFRKEPLTEFCAKPKDREGTP